MFVGGAYLGIVQGHFKFVFEFVLLILKNTLGMNKNIHHFSQD